MTFRSIKETARRALHGFMGQPASYYVTPSADPVLVTVRPHSKRGQIGDLPGTNLNYAETFDRKEQVVFWAEQVPAPAKGSLVVLSATEGYWVDTTEPRDGQTITANVVFATAEELAGLTLPGDL